MVTVTKSKAVKKSTAAANGVRHEVVEVTPEIAEKMLIKNTHNRKLNGRDVANWAREMAEGRWHFDGAPIRLAKDGTILDGQHRLSAVVSSGLTQKFLVITGLPVETQVTMDVGRRRTAGNALELMGWGGYSAAMAATARLAVKVDRYGINSDRFSGLSVSNQEIVDFAAENEDLLDAVKFAQSVYRNADVPSHAVAAYSYWRFSRIDADAALAFWTSASDKVGLQEGNPVLALTKRLADARRKREHISHQNQLSMIFRTWNAYREGRSMSKVPVRSGWDDIAVPEPI